jgi:hypothetical protein
VFKVYCDEEHFPLLLFIPLSAIIFPVVELTGSNPLPPQESSPLP